MNDKSVLIIGCGSTGLATAAHLSRQGVLVTVCDTPEQTSSFEAIRANGGIRLTGALEAEPVLPYGMTNDFTAALAAHELVIVCVSAGRHEEIIRLAAPYLTNRHCILFTPGTLGAVLLRRATADSSCRGYIVGETCGNLWACREPSPGVIFLGGKLQEKLAAAYPETDTAALVERFRPVLALRPGSNVLETALKSPNVVTHIAGTVMNAPQIEREGESFAMFQSGLSETVVRCFTALEAERNLVLHSLGLSCPPSDEPFNRALMADPVAPQLRCFKSLKGPSSMQHRYMSEDAACGVALLVSIGRKKGIPLPLTESFLTIASSVCEKDFLREGRTLENLNLTCD